LADQLADLLFQGAVMGDAPAAFAGLSQGEGFGGGLSLQEACPAVIGAVELGRFGFAAAVGFAAGAAGGGDAAWEQGEGDAEGDGFCGESDLFCLHVS
jgi:hypothetical protein